MNMYTLAMVPPHTMLAAVVGIGLFVFFMYRMLMRSGKARRAFDMDERESENAREILDEISRSEKALRARGKTLAQEKRQVNEEFNQIKNYKNQND